MMSGIYDRLSAIGTGIGAIGNAAASWATYESAKANAAAIRAASEYQRRQFERNQEFANLQAESALARGTTEANLTRAAGRRVIGAQRAALAASGIEVDSGTALELQAQTAGAAAMDAEAIRTNAWREAWGYRVEALNAGTSASLASSAGRVSAANTLLTGGLNALQLGFRGVSGAVDALRGASRLNTSVAAPLSSGTTYGINTRSYDANRATV